LILSFLGLPSSRKIKEKEAQSISILDGFKRIVRHRSALSCLVGTSLAMAAWTSVVSYGISFFRQQFQTPTEWAGMIWSGMALCFTIGSLVTGRLVDSYGRRPLTYISALLIGILTISFTNVPSLQVSIFFALLTSVLAGLRHSVSNSLSLEQVPEFRGAMMSLNSGSLRLGVALGSAIGGLALTLGGYNLVITLESRLRMIAVYDIDAPLKLDFSISLRSAAHVLNIYELSGKERRCQTTIGRSTTETGATGPRGGRANT